MKHFLFFSFMLYSIASIATTYKVGPSQTYNSIGSVPTHNLVAGDTVMVYYKPTPYYEKFLLAGVGTPTNPIVLMGIPDANGNMPILDGENAVSSTLFNFWNEDRQIIKVGQSGNSDYIIIDGFVFRNANNLNTFTDKNGVQQSYNANACAIRPEECNNLLVRNCEVYNCGNGLQGGNGNPQVFTIEKSYIHDNGLSNDPNSPYIHNFYGEGGQGSIFTIQYCRIGGVVGDGQNIKSRSDQNIIRYNWIEGGNNRQLDLVDGVGFTMDSYIYGNVIIKTQTDSNKTIVHWGQDNGHNPSGTLYFYNNTVVNKCNSASYFLSSASGRSLVAQNNIFYDASPSFSFGSFTGGLSGTNNWLSTSISGAGSLTASITGTDPMFISTTDPDYHLQSGSSCIDVVNGFTAPDGYLLDKEYVSHLSYVNRNVVNSNLDLGAYEYGTNLAIGKNRIKTGLKVYPNPFSEATTIDFTNVIKPSSGNFRFYLYNVLGKEVVSFINISEDKVILENKNLSSGVFVYKVFQNGNVVDVGKLVVK